MSILPNDQTDTVAPPEDYVEIADKIRSGEYFREARNMYDFRIHDPMAERYLYIFITAISLVVLLIALYAMQSIYPLNREVPLIVNSQNIVEDLPRIRSLQFAKGEDPGESLLRFMVKHYVEVREGYDIINFERDVNGVKSQSSEQVYKAFQEAIDPHNPNSPITMYQRHSRRIINVLSARHTEDGMEVIFEATVESKQDSKKTRWRADIDFVYSGIELDENSGNVKPVKFVVTKYSSKRLQDIK